MRKLSQEKRVAVLKALVDGCSVRTVTRLCGVSKLTVTRLLADVGQLCRDYHDIIVRGIRSKRIQVDEIWSFVGAKQRSVNYGACAHGDAWVWIAMDADTKLVISVLIGGRDSSYAQRFLMDVANRITTRVQLTSDGHHAYLLAVEGAFAHDIDYGMLQKTYGKPAGEKDTAERKYSPTLLTGAKRRTIIGNPDQNHISTSYIERQNLTLRMSQRRFTRLTNAFSKKIEFHAHAIALHYFFYNFIRPHKTLGMTPARAAGLIPKDLTMDDLVAMLEAEEVKLNKGGRINRKDRT